MELPKEIEAIVGGLAYETNQIGMSDSEVRIYRDYVLKIQKQSHETDNEYAIAKWLEGKIRVPKIHAYCIENETAYTLMSKIEGKMLCDKEYMAQPEALISLAAEGLKTLWQVDVTECPCTASRLTQRLKEGEYNVRNGLVDVENVEPETFGPNGFTDPQALLEWLIANYPEEDLVLTHGDYCLPNIFIDQDKISFIDIGKMGPADRWQDIAIAIRSLHHNFHGKYFGGELIYDFQPEMLMRELDIPFDEEKYRYYYLLDELF